MAAKLIKNEKAARLQLLKSSDRLSKIIESAEINSLELEDELTNYEELVKDLKKQIVPMENIKLKMASLDEDVFVLKRRLQGSMRSKKKEHKSDNELSNKL